MTYSMQCLCGETMSIEAENRVEAVSKMKAMMTNDAIGKHWMEKHGDDEKPMPSMEQVHMMIEQNLEPKA